MAASSQELLNEIDSLKSKLAELETVKHRLAVLESQLNATLADYSSQESGESHWVDRITFNGVVEGEAASADRYQSDKGLCETALFFTLA